MQASTQANFSSTSIYPQTYYVRVGLQILVALPLHFYVYPFCSFMSFCRVQPYNRCRFMIPHVPFVHLVWERLFDDHFLPHLVFLQ